MREKIHNAMVELVSLGRELQDEESLSEEELEDLLEQELAEALSDSEDEEDSTTE